MTIKERAVQRYKLHDWMSKSTRDAVKFTRKVFIEIATEQQELDIQRAVVWLESRCKMDEDLYSINLDEFKQAMKGE